MQKICSEILDPSIDRLRAALLMPQPILGEFVFGDPRKVERSFFANLANYKRKFPTVKEMLSKFTGSSRFGLFFRADETYDTWNLPQEISELLSLHGLYEYRVNFLAPYNATIQFRSPRATPAEFATTVLKSAIPQTPGRDFALRKSISWSKSIEVFEPEVMFMSPLY